MENCQNIFNTKIKKNNGNLAYHIAKKEKYKNVNENLSQAPKPTRFQLHLMYELKNIKDKMKHLESQIDKIATYLNQQ